MNIERVCLASILGVLLGLWLTFDVDNAQQPVIRVLLGCIAIGFYCGGKTLPKPKFVFAAAAGAASMSFFTVLFMAYAYDAGIRTNTVQSTLFSGQKLSLATPGILVFLSIFTSAVFLGVCLATYAKRPLVEGVSRTAKLDPQKVAVWFTAAAAALVAITQVVGYL